MVKSIITQKIVFVTSDGEEFDSEKSASVYARGLIRREKRDAKFDVEMAAVGKAAVGEKEAAA